MSILKTYRQVQIVIGYPKTYYDEPYAVIEVLYESVEYKIEAGGVAYKNKVDWKMLKTFKELKEAEIYKCQMEL